MQTEVLDEFLFAEGAPTEGKMQNGVDQVSNSSDSYDLTISIKKTEVIYKPAPGKPYKEPQAAPGKPYKEPTITMMVTCYA